MKVNEIAAERRIEMKEDRDNRLLKPTDAEKLKEELKRELKGEFYEELEEELKERILELRRELRDELQYWWNAIENCWNAIERLDEAIIDIELQYKELQRRDGLLHRLLRGLRELIPLS